MIIHVHLWTSSFKTLIIFKWKLGQGSEQQSDQQFQLPRTKHYREDHILYAQDQFSGGINCINTWLFTTGQIKILRLGSWYSAWKVNLDKYGMKGTNASSKIINQGGTCPSYPLYRSPDLSARAADEGSKPNHCLSLPRPFIRQWPVLTSWPRGSQAASRPMPSLPVTRYTIHPSIILTSLH